MNGEQFAFPIPEPLLDHLAERVAERLAERISPPPEPYLDSIAAAACLGYRGDRASAKMSALARAGKVPYYRDGSRLLFKRSDLDTYVSGGVR